MGDGVLPSDDGIVGEAGGDMMREICVDSWNNGSVRGYTTYGG